MFFSLFLTDQDPPDVQFNHQGYLFLATPDKADDLEKCVKLQRFDNNIN
jgi:hypothetical protein